MKLDELPQPEFVGTLPVDDLHVDGENPNSMDPDMFDHLKDRMKTRGWIGNAIITDTTGLIADGHHRWLAASDIGLEEVPVKQFNLTDAERRSIRQEMNKIHGEHDRDQDAKEFEKIMESDQADDLDRLLEARDESLEEYFTDDDGWDDDDFDDDDVAFKSECPQCGHEWYE